jgi:hypothetical protein
MLSLPPQLSGLVAMCIAITMAPLCVAANFTATAPPHLLGQGEVLCMALLAQAGAMNAFIVLALLMNDGTAQGNDRTEMALGLLLQTGSISGLCTMLYLYAERPFTRGALLLGMFPVVTVAAVSCLVAVIADAARWLSLLQARAAHGGTAGAHRNNPLPEPATATRACLGSSACRAMLGNVRAEP